MNLFLDGIHEGGAISMYIKIELIFFLEFELFKAKQKHKAKIQIEHQNFTPKINATKKKLIYNSLKIINQSLFIAIGHSKQLYI